jgi:hypothetical protein
VQISALPGGLILDTGIKHQLEELLRSRYHGAANVTGIRYQVAYSLLRAFDLYQPDGPTSIRLEGIEDVDVNGRRQVEARGFFASNQYVQVKTSKTAWDWSRFAQSKITDNFLPLWSADPSAELLVVTNFGYTGKLAELIKFCNGERSKLSQQVKNDLTSLCRRAGFPGVDVMEMLKRISFERISDEELHKRTSAAIARWFDLQSANSDLYLLVLMSKFLDLTAERAEVLRHTLEAIRLFVQESIELGTINPAVQSGWVERLRFSEEAHVEDYYEGSNARPGHILAALDVERASWLDRIHEALQRVGVCVIRTASGQGKSTLLYRYAYKHFQPETTFIVKHLSEESMVGAVKQTILARRSLGLPILVLIDNVRADLRFWHRLAGELAGQDVHLLVTMREEDWYRYSGGVSSFRREIVTPTLSLAEARQIYREFKQKNKIADGVRSAEWAFEQVAERQLLIEFTYLITHGQMLADRLSEQVRDMQHLSEDRAKLHILRLVSVAQAYEARVPVATLLRHVDFNQDPDSTIESLQREYLLCADGVCEGLHYVRSQHLATLLHRIVPLEQTMAELISILDADNLESFISAAFVDPNVEHASLLQALTERGRREPLDVVNRIAKALFAASETLYYRAHEAQFDRAVEGIGSSIPMILCSATLPFQTIDFFGNLRDIFPNNPNMSLLSDLVREFTPRRWGERIEVRFLRDIIDHVDSDYLRHNFTHLGSFLYWCRLPSLETSRLSDLLAAQDWRKDVYQADLQPTADFLSELRNYTPESYDSIVASDRRTLLSRFKLISDTLMVEERGGDVYIEFVVEEGDKSSLKPHEQAWGRLRNLYKFFPDYNRYCSQGLYAASHGVEHPIDDTHKEAGAEAFGLEAEAERNSVYVQTVEAHYAATFVYQWQEQWFNFRRDLSALMGRIFKLFQDRRAHFDELNAAWLDLVNRSQQMIKLPGHLKERFAEEQRSIDSWAGSVDNFLRQVSQSDENSRRLMRHNLRDAAKHLPHAQRAFGAIIADTQMYFDLPSLDAGEVEQYELLADVLDIFLDEPPQTPVKDLRAFVRERRERRRREFADAVRSALSPLEEHGFAFSYPHDRLVEFPLIGICVGFEVLDFEQVTEQMAVIISLLATFPLEYHFLYLVPLLDGASYLQNVWRISSDTIRKLAAGTPQEDPWTLLPVEEPAELLTILPEIYHVKLPEFDILSRFYDLYVGLNSVRNTAYFATSRLNGEQKYDVQLGGLYQQRLQRKADEILEEYSALTDQMLEFEPEKEGDADAAVQRLAWLTFCRRCVEKFESLRENLNVDPENFESINIWQDRELETLFGHYLNAKYRHHLTGDDSPQPNGS